MGCLPTVEEIDPSKSDRQVGGHPGLGPSPDRGSRGSDRGGNDHTLNGRVGGEVNKWTLYPHFYYGSVLEHLEVLQDRGRGSEHFVHIFNKDGVSR